MKRETWKVAECWSLAREIWNKKVIPGMDAVSSEIDEMLKQFLYQGGRHGC